MFKMGHIPDSPSDKDIHFSTVSNKFAAVGKDNTDSEYFITEYTPISNQGGLNSCVGNSSTDALEILMGQKGKVVQLSRLFTYYNARLYHNAQKIDDGTMIRYAFNSFQRYGACLESTWQYDEAQVFKQPLLESYKEGQDNLITAYYKINESGKERSDAIETAIRSGHPVCFGCPVSKEYTEYWNGDENKVWLAPTSNIVGGHAELITAVRYKNGRQFYIRNSWGEKWGIQGHSWFDSSYIEWEQATDFWVGTLMDQLII